MNKKKLVSLCLVLALVLTAAIGGTMAYFTDKAYNENTMTLGGVDIAQHEYQRAVDEDGAYETTKVDGQDSYVLEGFEQDKPLLPIVGDPSESGSNFAGWDNTIVRMTQVGSYGNMQVFAGKVAQDKFVTVENTGKSDAYVRTLVAVEAGSTDGKLIGTSYHQTWNTSKVGLVEINGNNYVVTEYLYAGGQLSDGSWRHENGALPAGQTTYPNLSQVYLKYNATNDDAKAIDGNNNGKVDILVLSQAAQVSGFDNAKTALDTAFGESTVANVKAWFEAL